MKRNAALAYVRISRDDPDREKVSPDMQRQACISYPDVQGLDLEMYDHDIGISGKDTEHRPDFLRMMERLGRGDVKYVIAYDQSRITRNVGDLQAGPPRLTTVDFPTPPFPAPTAIACAGTCQIVTLPLRSANGLRSRCAITL